ncbi:MAG: tRNA-dihydrouridine synthase, partial [Synergistaceae bacterium]|nr:tRNA-dihydrouridine synthase [Synergistaceae bacterium]
LPPPSLAKKMETAIRHGKMLAALKGEKIAVQEMRRHLAWYVKGLPHAAGLRAAINQTRSLTDMRDLSRQTHERTKCKQKGIKDIEN